MADNYTALKSSQKKRYISKETFNSLDLSKVPVGSEYEVVSPIEKGDLSADINNALNKAEKSISEPTNQTTGSVGDVLSKTANGSQWKSIKVLPDASPSVGEVLGCTTEGTPEWIPGVLGVYNHYMRFKTASSEEVTLTKVSTYSENYTDLASAYQKEITHCQDLDLPIPVVGTIISGGQRFSAVALNGAGAVLYGEGGTEIDISDMTEWSDTALKV